MKILNKIISVLCITALLISAVPVVAQTTPTLYFTNNTVVIGSTSTAYCYLSMNNAENISAMDYRIFYDANNLEFTQMYNTGFTSQSDVTVSVNSSEPGIIHVTLISQKGLNGSNYLNLMYFKAKEGAKAGTYPISVLVTDMFNSSLETVEATTQSGTMTVKEATTTVKNVSFSNTVSSTSIRVGDNVDYKLSASSLNSLSAGSFEFTYDETKLALNDVVLSSALQNTVCDINDSIDGFVKVSFAYETMITSGSNLITLKFSAKASGTADISFAPKDLYDYSFNGMSGNTLSKSVSIAEPEIVVDYPDLKIVTPENICSDKEFEVKVQLEGGSGVRAGDFVVNYNDVVLECVGLTTETVDGAWLTADRNFTEGKARFSLMSNVDMEEDTVLVTLTFKAIENIDSISDIRVSGADIYDVNFNPITLEYIGAEVKAIRPEYTVNFYDADGTTLLLTQNVMSGNSAIAPDAVQIKKNDNANHLKFSGWDKDYSQIMDNTDFVAVYTEEAHTVITQAAVEQTCTKTGLTEGKYCVVCDGVLVEQQVIPANGHTVVIDDAVEQTCTEKGLTEGSHCVVCEEVLVAQQVISAKGHSPISTPSVAPGFDTIYGSENGIHCDTCGFVLIEPKPIKPTGPIVSAVLGSDESLAILGGISDNKVATDTVFVAVYDSFGKMIKLKNITALDQSNLDFSIENMKDADSVKILRLAMEKFRPLYSAFEVSVKSE